MRPPAPEPGSLSETDHLGFDGGPQRHRMGVRRLGAEPWIENDHNGAAQQAIKARLLTERRNDVVAEPDSTGAIAATTILETLIRAELPKDASPPPGQGGATIENCALLTQEDWCVMVREDTWRLRAACVCFPSRWVLAEKVGGTVAAIHGAVPRYEAELGGKVESFMDRLELDKPVWRTNWNLWDDPRLFQPREDPDGPQWDLPTGDEVGERVFLRVERQTLRRISGEAAAFGIRVHQRPLSHVANQRGAIELLDKTLDRLRGSPSGTKKLGRLWGPVTEWVRDMQAPS